MTQHQIYRLNKGDKTQISFSQVKISTLKGGFLQYLQPLLKNVVSPLILSATMSAADAGIQKSIYRSDNHYEIILKVSIDNFQELAWIVSVLEEANKVSLGTSEIIESHLK